jgi:uncharacterized membrane protein
MAQQTLTIISPDLQTSKTNRKVLKHVSFQIKGSGLFELVGKDKKVIQELNLNNRGSDGMSDFVFPYEVKWVADGQRSELYGGCESNYLKRLDPQN